MRNLWEKYSEGFKMFLWRRWGPSRACLLYHELEQGIGVPVRWPPAIRLRRVDGPKVVPPVLPEGFIDCRWKPRSGSRWSIQFHEGFMQWPKRLSDSVPLWEWCCWSRQCEPMPGLSQLVPSNPRLLGRSRRPRYSRWRFKSFHQKA